MDEAPPPSSSSSSAYQRDYARPLPPPFQFSRNPERDGTSHLGSRDDLVHVLIDDDVPEIPKSQFEDCRNLQTVQIVSCITKVGNRTFQKCSSLIQIEFSHGLQTIGGCAFLGCHALTSVKSSPSSSSSGVTRIGEYAFEGCSSLKSITMNMDHLEFIGFKAFAYCESLQEIPLDNRPLSIVNRFDKSQFPARWN